jgi:hypothetical protein
LPCGVVEEGAESYGSQGLEMLCQFQACDQFTQLDFVSGGFIAQYALFRRKGKELALFYCVVNMSMYEHFFREIDAEVEISELFQWS